MAEYPYSGNKSSENTDSDDRSSLSNGGITSDAPNESDLSVDLAAVQVFINGRDSTGDVLAGFDDFIAACKRFLPQSLVMQLPEQPEQRPSLKWNKGTRRRICSNNFLLIELVKFI